MVAFVKVTRWTRYGHDRLYLKADDGADLGWWDLKAHQAHPTPAGTEELLATIASDWRASAEDPQQPRPGEQTTTAPPHPSPSPSGPDVDAAPATTPPASAEPPIAVEADWAPPHGPPVRDLAQTPPGANLYEHVAAAHAAGQRPTFFRKLFYGKYAYSSWERGLIGEQLVEAELRKLVTKDPRWGYLNSIPIGENGADIDHFVAGPAGAFTINAKYHRGASIWVGGNTLMVNGTRHPYIRNARHEAQRAAKLLTKATRGTVEVLGLVVPVDARNFTVREQPADVRVVNRRRLVEFLRGLPTVMADDRVLELLSAARLSTTWER